MRPIFVGLCVLSLGLGAMAAAPFQKASWLSRARWRTPTTASMTLQQQPRWSSHLIRRTAFTLLLPVSGITFAATSTGPSFSVVVPCVVARCLGFFSSMAIAECSGLLLETFDTSDLQLHSYPGWSRRSVVQRCGDHKANFSCYPRVSAGLAVTQTMKYCLAAAATGVGGRLERRLGAVQAAAAVAGILLLMTLLLTVILFRWKTVQIVPNWQLLRERRASSRSTWNADIPSTPQSTTRKISILEAGKMTRWSEIRQRNTGLTGG